MKFIYDNIMYAELNTKSDFCDVCGYDGEIQIKEDENGKLIWECPNCGNRNQDKMSVARRTCGIHRYPVLEPGTYPSDASSGISNVLHPWFSVNYVYRTLYNVTTEHNTPDSFLNFIILISVRIFLHNGILL